jgi:hypothetical protein
MLKPWLIPIAAIAFAAPAAYAHGPSRQKVSETVTLNAPPEKVWAVIGNFHDMSWDPNVVKTEGEGGNTLQSFRTLTLKNGGQIKEDLERYNAEDHSYSTFLPHVDPKAFPVTDFSTEISVEPADGGKSTVEWRAAFYRGDPNNDPPPDLNDAAAVKAAKAYLQAGLDGLKAKFGGSGS